MAFKYYYSNKKGRERKRWHYNHFCYWWWIEPMTKFLLVYHLLILCCSCFQCSEASEYPGRECCDSAPPPPPQYYTTTSTSPVPPILRKHYTHTTKLVPNIPGPPQPPYVVDYTVPPTGGKWRHNFILFSNLTGVAQGLVRYFDTRTHHHCNIIFQCHHQGQATSDRWEDWRLRHTF